MAEEIAKHVDHQKHRGNEVEHCCDDSMPKPLRVGFTGSYGRNIFIHGNNDTNELETVLVIETRLNKKTLTIPLAKYHAIMVSGKATIYLTLRVKFSSKQKLPKKPQARDIAFKMTSLYIIL
jgi:hypothetical protein